MSQTILLNGSFADSLINFRGPLIAELVRRGYSVHVSAPRIPQDIRRQVAALGAIAHEVPLARAGLSPLGDLAYCRRLFSLIRRVGADQVVGYTIKPNIWGAIAAWLAGARSASMVTGLGFAFLDGEGNTRRHAQWLAQRLYALATRLNHRVVFQNPDDRRDFIAAGCLDDPGKAAVVDGSGVDTGRFRPAPLPSGADFLLIARLLRTKGVEEYVEAAGVLRARFPEAAVRIAGFFDEGPDALPPRLAEDWRRAGIDYLGPLADVRPAIAASSVYVLPSYREGTPRTVLEAMAMGRAIVTTDAPGCRETVRPGENGLLVPVRDAASLADAMAALASDAGLRERMGRASRAIAVEKYDVEKVNAALIAALDLGR